jgi:uncharacterized RmlC-like cupin family protein
MTEPIDWKTGGVTVVRAGEQDATRLSSGGRATAFNFAGTGGERTWIGTVTMQPNTKSGAHNHGRHEAALYVVKGRGEIRWGERLEFAAEVGGGDFVYFAPYVPHQERNLDAVETLDFVVIRSDNERIVVPLELDLVEKPELVF